MTTWGWVWGPGQAATLEWAGPHDGVLTLPLILVHSVTSMTLRFLIHTCVWPERILEDSRLVGQELQVHSSKAVPEQGAGTEDRDVPWPLGWLGQEMADVGPPVGSGDGGEIYSIKTLGAQLNLHFR